MLSRLPQPSRAPHGDAHLNICAQCETMSSTMRHTKVVDQAGYSALSVHSSPAVQKRSVTMSSTAPRRDVCPSRRAATPSTASSEYDTAYSQKKDAHLAGSRATASAASPVTMRT